MTPGTPDPDWWERACRGPINLAPLDISPELGAAQAGWRASLARSLYGAIPGPPEDLSLARHPLPDDGAERIALTLSQDGRRFDVDCAFWRPATTGPAPLIVGLDFVGPVGVLASDAFPLDAEARIYTRPEHGAEGRMTDALRGTQATRWPIEHLTKAGFAVLLGCYGSWAPDDPGHIRNHGIAPLMGNPDTGAISLWAWSLRRMLDVATRTAEIDSTRIAVAGHSRLGKAALWAAANDTRIGAVFANQSGAAGAAPAAHTVGETLDQLYERFPHWTIRAPGSGPPALDQHALIAAIAPRAVYLAGATDDLWADPVGSMQALQAAAPAWGIDAAFADPMRGRAGPLGYHIRAGDHDLTLADWAGFLDFLADLGWSGPNERENP